MRKLKPIKLIVILLFILISLGFRVLTAKKWMISESDPYLWIRHCNLDTEIEINDVNDGDELFGESEVTVRRALESVVAETNSIFGSYLRIELYPEDVNNLPVGSTFTLERAKSRTIDICTETPGGAAGGSASLKIDKKNIIGCEIIYKEETNKSVTQFLRLIEHELGHCYGLAHPQEIKDALMSYYADDEAYRYLIDDKIGLRYLYPSQNGGFSLKETPTYGLKCEFKK